MHFRWEGSSTLSMCVWAVFRVAISLQRLVLALEGRSLTLTAFFLLPQDSALFKNELIDPLYEFMLLPAFLIIFQQSGMEEVKIPWNLLMHRIEKVPRWGKVGVKTHKKPSNDFYGRSLNYFFFSKGPFVIIFVFHLFNLSKMSNCPSCPCLHFCGIAKI